MESDDLNKRLSQIVAECVELKNKYVEEKDLPVDYICIFSHSKSEYDEVEKLALQNGKIIETTLTGPIFKFIVSPLTMAGKPKVFKIRQPDETRPELGDVDFTTNYEKFKSKYLDNNKFKLVKRETFEMLELKDPDFNVRVYFSSTPPSRLRGIN